MVQYKYSIVEDLRRFLKIEHQLTDRTVKDHKNILSKFLQTYDGSMITRRNIQDYLSKIENKNTYRNNLSTLKILFRDFMRMSSIIDGFRFPKTMLSPKMIPTKEELQAFYNAIDNLRDKTIFLLFATSGLRMEELLNITSDEVDFKKRMLSPKSNGTTKLTWISFYNSEAEGLLSEYLQKRDTKSKRLFPHSESEVKKIWFKTRQQTKFDITPQVLREWFAEEMSNRGVSERYVDGFCGRVPRTIIGRYYSDHRPDKLKTIYDKADLKVLS